MNPAGRIKAIVEHFCMLGADQHQVQGWEGYVKKMGGLHDESVHDSVLLALRSTLKELRLLSGKAKHAGIPAHLYQPVVDGLADAFSTPNLHRKWSQGGDFVRSGEVRVCLSWLEWTLAHLSEKDLDEGLVAALISAIAEQESLLQHTGMPEGLRDLLETQLAELRTALLLYRISGIQPMVDAVNKQSGEMRNAPADLVAEVAEAPPEAREALSKGMQLIGKAAKVADSGSKIVKFAKEVYEVGASGWQMFGQNLLGP